jgi:hypothetical protein
MEKEAVSDFLKKCKEINRERRYFFIFVNNVKFLSYFLAFRCFGIKSYASIRTIIGDDNSRFERME